MYLQAEVKKVILSIRRCCPPTLAKQEKNEALSPHKWIKKLKKKNKNPIPI